MKDNTHCSVVAVCTVNGLYMELWYVTIALTVLGCQIFGTRASSCPSGTLLLPLPDGTMDCLHCSQCPHGQEVKIPCSHATDTVCAPCQQDFFYQNTTKTCKNCTSCEPGYHIAEVCTKYTDASCMECSTGTFSDSENSKVCRRCTVCDTDVLQDCVKTYDTVCSPKLIGKLFIVLIVITVILALLHIFYCAIILYRKEVCVFPRKRHYVDERALSEAEALRGNQFTELHSSSQDNGVGAVSDAETINEKNEKQEILELHFTGRLYPIIENDQTSLREYMERWGKSVGAILYQNIVVTVFCIGTTQNRYIMTAYSEVKELLSSNKINDLDVTFEETATRSTSGERKFRVLSPLFVNKSNDIVILKVSNPSELPESLNLIPDVTQLKDDVGFITIGKRVQRKRRLEYTPVITKDSKEYREVVTSSLAEMPEQVTSAAIRRSYSDGDASGRYSAMVILRKSGAAIGPGSPGFAEVNGRYGVVCMFTQTIPNVTGTQLNRVAGRLVSEEKSYCVVPSMSALYRELQSRNNNLVDELFEPRDSWPNLGDNRADSVK